MFPAKPQIKQIDPAIFLEVRSARLDNDIPLYMIEAGTEDILRIEFTFRAGQACETIPLLSSASNMMLGEGSANYSSAKINKLLDYYGSFHNLYCEKERAGLIVYFMNRHGEKVLEFSKEMLFDPVFPANELKGLMKKRLRWFMINKEKVQNLALDHFYEAIFGNNHPYGRLITESDFVNLNPSILRKFHSDFYTPHSLAIIVAGKIRSDTVEIINKLFGGIKKDHGQSDNKTSLPDGLDRRKIHIDKPGAVQTAVRIGSVTINKRNSDYPGLKITDTILGGYFGSRLMKNIREDKGLTYGIYSSVNSLNICGYKVISTEVSKKFTQKAIDEIHKEIRKLQQHHVGDDELGIVRNYMHGEMIRMFDGPFAIAESFRSVWEMGLDNSYYSRLSEKIKSIEADEIMHMAKTYYNPDGLYEITAG
jgi:zinc protease